MIAIKNYISGGLVEPKTQNYLEVINPATGEVIARAPDSGPEDAAAAVKSAQDAFEAWAKTPTEARAKILHNIANLIDLHREELAKLEALDSGKPYSLAYEKEIPRAAQNFRYFASAISTGQSECFPMGEQGFNYVLRPALGPVVCISPWNLPLYLFSWKIAPALAAGCTVIGKPSELTPLTAFKLSEICKEAGLPPGVLNIVHGYGAKIGEALTRNPAIKAISFTGGTETGKKIMGGLRNTFLPVSLELGGKNPALVFKDCDLELTVNELIRASFTNSGQICLCASRLYIEEPIYEAFKSLFLTKTKMLSVGDPFHTETSLGPLISKEHRLKVKGFVDRAEQNQCSLLLDGRSTMSAMQDGFYFGPTIIEGAALEDPINQQEIFGPVVTLASFKDFNEAMSLANGTPYGLSATVWTKDLSTAHRAAHQLDAGIVWINSWMVRDLRTPFGGMKASGLGREGGNEALKFFTETKNIFATF